MRFVPQLCFALGIATGSPVAAEVVVSNLANVANDGYALFYNQWLGDGRPFGDGRRFSHRAALQP
jgi:hypothetical protein